MPTAYTASVVDGNVTDFKQFALSCARAFGALIEMRDEPMDAPIPDELKADTYYEKRLAESKKRLAEIQVMTDADADALANEEYREILRTHAENLARQTEEKVRIGMMLAKVRAWSPPTEDHAGLKSFMIEQLTISMPYESTSPPPMLLNGAAWRKQETDRLAKDIVYQSIKALKESERSIGRHEWLRQLRNSLGQTERVP